MTKIEMIEAELKAADAAHDEVVQRVRNAERAYKRSRSEKNGAELVAARRAAEVQADACLQIMARLERAETVARRLALVAPRREMRARQGELF